MIKTITIKNFRGIDVINQLPADQLNIFIGNNGTSKTSILDAIHFAFSPSFLSGRIKHTDFPNGNDENIFIEIELSETIKAKIPDYFFNEQEITCNKIHLEIKKRDRKAAGKVFSDLVTINHIALPDFAPGEKGWTIKRKSGNDLTFTERALGLNQLNTDELPRSFLFNKERDRQLQKGYNSSFSTIIEDLNWRFSRSIRKDKEETGKPPEVLLKIPELTNEIAAKIDFDKYEVFKEFRKRTTMFGIEEIKLSILDSTAPYESAFLSSSKEILDLPIKYLGSGVEMIVSLLFLETLASMSKERLLILIDEPELHLHPKLQEQLAEYLWNISLKKNGHQVFITTHSPVFFKNCVGRLNVKTFVTTQEKQTNKVLINEISLGKGLFPWGASWGEINYFAYNYLTIEFHDELYGYIQEKTSSYTEQQIDDLLEHAYGIPRDRQWIPEKNGVPLAAKMVTLPVFIRNKVHHPENRTMQSMTFNEGDLQLSTEQLIKVVKAVK